MPPQKHPLKFLRTNGLYKTLIRILTSLGISHSERKLAKLILLRKQTY